jgi:cytochrome c-type biogenesis protein CcmH/NrfG
MAWAAILVLAALVVAGLWRFGGLRGASLQFAAAGLLFAFAGYAWQGRPALPGKPAPAPGMEKVPDNLFTRLRPHMLGRFDAAARWLTIAEMYQRRGDGESAVAVIRSGLRAHPRDPNLWTGLANALRVHAGGRLAPAADLAFRRALALGPRHTGPLFFYAEALAENGRFDEAERLWTKLLATGRRDAAWRPMVEERLALIAHARATGQIS